jgi:hypothetical protein
MKAVKKCGLEVERLEMLEKKSKKEKSKGMNHVIGVAVESGNESVMVDNGIAKTGSKYFTVENLAAHMHSIKKCYCVDLYFV